MKPIFFKLLIVFCLIVGMNFFQLKESLYHKEYHKDDVVFVMINGKKHKIAMNDYLLGVVAGEMPASFDIEAIKAQVLASRTFVYHRNLNVDNTTNSQVYLTNEQIKKAWGSSYDKYRKKVMKAILETKGEIITYQGKCISALFYSSSNGRSENVENYFSGDGEPYLISVDSSFDQQIDPLFIRKKEYTQKQLNQIFNVHFEYHNIKRYESGRVKSIKIGQKIYTGRQVRELLKLSSSDFTIQKENNSYIFITKGSGHGVGMSQYGAQALALKGYKYDDIIKHYYVGTEISHK